MALTLAAVESAIETLIAGNESASIGDITYRKSSLPQLWQARRELKAESDRANRPLVRAVNFGSMGYGSASDNDATVTLTESVSA